MLNGNAAFRIFRRFQGNGAGVERMIGGRRLIGALGWIQDIDPSRADGRGILNCNTRRQTTISRCRCYADIAGQGQNVPGNLHCRGQQGDRRLRSRGGRGHPESGIFGNPQCGERIIKCFWV